MHGLMQDQPLLISSLITYADRHHGATEIVSRTIEGPIHRYTYREAHARARRLANALKRLGVKHLYLFGSTARGEARVDSDVDLFFDHPEGSLGLFALMDVKEAAARIVGHKTDIMTRRSLHPVLRERIEASALQVF